MQFGQGWDDADPDRVVPDIRVTLAEIARHNADIILLQEVEHAQPGGRQVQPPPNYTSLKEGLPGYHSVFAYPKEDARELPFGIGLAIFSRTPLTDFLRVDLPSPPIEFDFFGRKTTPTDRVMIGAKTRIGTHELQIFNVHLLAFFMLGSSSTAHPWQRDLVANHLKSSKIPTIIGGDFNVSKHQSLVSQFGIHGYKTVQHEKTTWRRRPYILDHVFYNGPLKPVRHAVEPTSASDHHALVAELDFAK